MEAKKKKRPAKETKPVEEEVPEDETPTDYTEEDGPTDDEEDTDPEEEETPADDEVPEDEEPTDYTDEEGENVDSVEEEPVEGDEPPADEEPTDYTDEQPEGGTGDEPVEDGDPNATGDTPEEEETPEEDPEGEVPPEEETVAESKNMRLLLEDYTDLYFRTKDFISKLSSLDKSNMILNQIIVQMDKNLNRLKQALWDYISFEFDKVNYTTNIFKYNLFVEAFQVNLEMLHTAKDAMLKDDQKDEKKPQRRKRNQ